MPYLKPLAHDGAVYAATVNDKVVEETAAPAAQVHLSERVLGLLEGWKARALARLASYSLAERTTLLVSRKRNAALTEALKAIPAEWRGAGMSAPSARRT